MYKIQRGWVLEVGKVFAVTNNAKLKTARRLTHDFPGCQTSPYRLKNTDLVNYSTGSFGSNLMPEAALEVGLPMGSDVTFYLRVFAPSRRRHSKEQASETKPPDPNSYRSVRNVRSFCDDFRGGERINS